MSRYDGGRFETEENVEQNAERRDARDDHFKSTYELKCSEKYEANEYSYKTDAQGRITRCQGTLRLEDGERSLSHQRMAGGEDRRGRDDPRGADDGGHLIARRFGGSDKVDNIVPMNSSLNRGEYKRMENDWESALQDGKKVDADIKIRYEGDSKRPTDFHIVSKISDDEGVLETKTYRFRNEASQDK